ncbi:MAG: hypothetical protein PHW83_00080 [Bacteroidales bacterium]|nr:hypothetical protein [Bacteroidales bacterium]
MKMTMTNLTTARYLRIILSILFFVMLNSTLFSQSSEGIKARNQKTLKRVVITNSKLPNTDLRLKINDNIWYSTNELQQDIKKQNYDSITGIEKGISDIFLFCIEHTTHFPISKDLKSELSNPISYLNSCGYGVCDEKSMFLSEILNLLGYTSRIVHLGGHSVCEVMNNGNFIVLDITNSCVISDNKGNLLSLEKAEKCNDCSMVNVTGNYELRQLLNYLDQTAYFSLYKTSKNNNTNLVSNSKVSQFSGISLPQKSKIKIAFPDSKIKDIFPEMEFSITYKKTKLKANIPFSIESVEGNGNIKNLETGQIFKPGDQNISAGIYEISAKKIILNLNLNSSLLSSKTNDISILGEVPSEIKIKKRFAKNHAEVIRDFPSKISQLKLDNYNKLFSEFDPHIDTSTNDIFLSLLTVTNTIYLKVYNDSTKGNQFEKTLSPFINYLYNSGISTSELKMILNYPAYLKSIIIGLIEYEPEDMMLLLNMKEAEEKQK